MKIPSLKNAEGIFVSKILFLALFFSCFLFCWHYFLTTLFLVI